MNDDDKEIYVAMFEDGTYARRQAPTEKPATINGVYLTHEKNLNRAYAATGPYWKELVETNRIAIHELMRSRPASALHIEKALRPQLIPIVLVRVRRTVKRHMVAGVCVHRRPALRLMPRGKDDVHGGAL